MAKKQNKDDFKDAKVFDNMKSKDIPEIAADEAAKVAPDVKPEISKGIKKMQTNGKGFQYKIRKGTVPVPKNNEDKQGNVYSGTGPTKGDKIPLPMPKKDKVED